MAQSTGLTLLANVFGIQVGDALVVWVGSVVIVVLIALSAFFSSSEIAMFSLARHRLEALVEDGAPGAATVAE